MKIFPLVILFSALNCYSQTIFQKTYGGIPSYISDDGKCVQQTSDSGFIITGMTRSFEPNQNSDVYLVKTDQNGNVVWNKVFGGERDEAGYSVQQTNDGGYIVAGYTDSVSNTGKNILLIRIDANGNMLWNKIYVGSGDDIARSIEKTSDGGFIIAGNGSGYGSFAPSGIILIKTNANGDTLWSRVFGNMYDAGNCVQQTIDGGYIIGGTINAHLGLIKTNSLGDTLWIKQYGEGQGSSVCQTTDGGYILAGSTASYGAGWVDIYLTKTDSSGNIQWTKTFGGTDGDWANSVQQTTDGGYIIAGRSASFVGENVWLVKAHISGGFTWSQIYRQAGQSVGNYVRQTYDGGYVIIGTTLMDYELHLIKTDASGASGCIPEPPSVVAGTHNIPIFYSPTSVSRSSFNVGTLTNIQTQSGGATNVFCYQGIDNPAEESDRFSLLPNPATNKFIIYDERFTIEGIDIYSAEGKRIFTQELTANSRQREIKIDVTQCDNGIYFVKIKTSKGDKTQKLIVQH